MMDLSLNGHPVYRHEFFDLYLYLNAQNGMLCVGSDLDVSVDGCVAEIDPELGGPMSVWNRKTRLFEEENLLSFEPVFELPEPNLPNPPQVVQTTTPFLHFYTILLHLSAYAN